MRSGFTFIKFELKPAMLHLGLRVIILCSNDDPRLTLTNFTAISNVVFLEFIRGNLVESYLIGKKTYSK